MLIENKDIVNVLGPNLKKARNLKGYTQEFVAENINISTDLLRNIGSLPTLLNLCNFLDITPNYLFGSLLNKSALEVDYNLKNYFSSISKESKEAIKQIIIHLDKNY